MPRDPFYPAWDHQKKTMLQAWCSRHGIQYNDQAGRAYREAYGEGHDEGYKDGWRENDEIKKKIKKLQEEDRKKGLYP